MGCHREKGAELGYLGESQWHSTEAFGYIIHG